MFIWQQTPIYLILYLKGHLLADISVMDLLTTEALRRPMEGGTPGLQISLQESTRLSGLVAHLTSVRPWAQAEEDTSQRKAKAAVTTRSWQGWNRVTLRLFTYTLISLRQLSAPFASKLYLPYKISLSNQKQLLFAFFISVGKPISTDVPATACMTHY